MRTRAADRNQGGVGDLKYPLVSDLKREITTRYNVLTPDGVALRGLFIIDKEARASPGQTPQAFMTFSNPQARGGLDEGWRSWIVIRWGAGTCFLSHCCCKACQLRLQGSTKGAG